MLVVLVLSLVLPLVPMSCLMLVFGVDVSGGCADRDVVDGVVGCGGVGNVDIGIVVGVVVVMVVAFVYFVVGVAVVCCCCK